MDLRTLRVEEYTTPNPYYVELKTNIEEIWKIMTKKGIRHVLVKDEKEKICGLVSDRDVRTFSQSEDVKKITAKDIMATDLLTVSPEAKLYEVALEMSKNKFGSTLIKDEQSGYLGIFTATDALNALVEILRGDFNEKE